MKLVFYSDMQVVGTVLGVNNINHMKHTSGPLTPV